MTRSVVALVNGRPWDMHAPLEEDCELQFLHFKDEDPSICNKVSEWYIQLCSPCNLRPLHSRIPSIIRLAISGTTLLFSV